MPLFKKFSSKNDASENNLAPDVIANNEKDNSPQIVAVTADGPVPEYSDSLKGACTAVHQELPRPQGAEKFLNKIGASNIAFIPRLAAIVDTLPCFCTNFYREGDFRDSTSLSPEQQTVVDTLAVPVRALMDTPQITETIREGVNTFMETVPVLMKALDEVAKVHPFIYGASILSLSVRNV